MSSTSRSLLPLLGALLFTVLLLTACDPQTVSGPDLDAPPDPAPAAWPSVSTKCGTGGGGGGTGGGDLPPSTDPANPIYIPPPSGGGGDDGGDDGSTGGDGGDGGGDEDDGIGSPPQFDPVIAGYNTNSGDCGEMPPPPCIDCGDVSEPVGWGKAINIGQKMLDAARRGEDLLDARTWKNMLQSEWADAAQAGMDAQAALNGDPVALLSVLDYIAAQTVGFGFFDMIQGLKVFDRLGPGWYDDVIGYLHNSRYFPRIAQASGDFANTIDDVNLLERVGKLDKVKDDKYGNPIYRIVNGNSQRVMDSFADRWGLSQGRNELQMGNIQLNRYNATGGSGRATINVNDGGYEFKVRFEKN